MLSSPCKVMPSPQNGHGWLSWMLIHALRDLEATPSDGGARPVGPALVTLLALRERGLGPGGGRPRRRHGRRAPARVGADDRRGLQYDSGSRARGAIGGRPQCGDFAL